MGATCCTGTPQTNELNTAQPVKFEPVDESNANVLTEKP